MRDALFIVGVILMFIGLFVPSFVAENPRFHPLSVYHLGLAIALAAHGWPASFS